MTAAQYKTKFDTAQTNATNKAGTIDAFGGGADRSLLWSTVAATWGFLYIERSRFAKQGFTPSAAAEAYATQAEQRLASAEANSNTTIPVGLAYASIASNAAFLFAEQVRVDHTTPGEL